MTAFEYFGDEGNYGTPRSDIEQALEWADTYTATDPFEAERLDKIDPSDVAEVVHWDITYHGEDWTGPEDYVGTELDMVMVVRLHDGSYASLSAGNDYTGWGCMGDHAEVRVGTYDEVINYGLDKWDRKRLGLDEPETV